MQSKGSISAAVASATYSFGQNQEQALALVALSHTVVEHQLYCAMLAEISSVGTRVASFTIRGLMNLTGLGGYSTVRRGLAGLGNKLSIERQKVAGNNGNHQPQTVYLVFTPVEILERRRAVGIGTNKALTPHRRSRHKRKSKRRNTSCLQRSVKPSAAKRAY